MGFNPRIALLMLLLAATSPAVYAQAGQADVSPPPPAGASSSAATPAASPAITASATASEEAEPGLVTLVLTETQSMDTEMIQWPDGGFSVPVKALAALFDINVQQSDDEKRLFYVDPVSRQKVEIYWGEQRITINDRPLPTPSGSHPIIRSEKGLLVKDDVYLDQALFAALFQVKFAYDSDATTLALSTERKLKLAQADGGTETLNGTDANIRIIRNPDVAHRLIEKVYIHHDGSYNAQVSRQPSGPDNEIQSTLFTTMMNNSTIGIGGSMPGVSYYLKPSVVRFNGKANFQQIDWSIEHAGKRNVLSLGSGDAGLSALASPALNVWGLRLASRNALTPVLSSQPSYELLGKANNGNQVTVRINGRTIQTTTAKDNAYEFEPIYLQPQAVNHIEVIEKNGQHQETRLFDKTVGYFANLLPRREPAYSLFFGRTPLQFHPLIPDQKTPILMPQSEKWLTGGRFFYGLSNRLTVGVAGAADHIFGKPKTYYTNLNPFSVDLTGFSSYQRDPNFFSGRNITASLRYQLTDHWLVSADAGMSRMAVKSGNQLSSLDGTSGKAGLLHLERQGNLLSWYADVFHYDPYYYTPSTMLYGNNLYDKQGVSTGLTGSVGRRIPIHYGVNWERYRTNLQQLIPGGFINADRWGGSLNSQITRNNNLGLTAGWLKGANREREFQQRFLDVTLRSRSLPWHIQGEVRASHYFTNTLLLPSRSLGTQLVESPYENNILDASLDIPFGPSGVNHLKIGNRFSSFVNYGYLQGAFQYRQFFIEPVIQLSYGDKPQIQHRFGLKVGYKLNSGARVSVAYYKLLSTFQPTQGALPASQINTDQVYFDFSDILGLMASRFRSLGPNADATGGVAGTLFADYHSDGKPDKTEPGVRNIRMMIDHQTVATTDARGRYRLTGLTPGYHTIELLPEGLPLTLNAENPMYKIKVSQGKTHRLDIALMPEGGTLSGRLSLVDANGKTMEPKNITLVLSGADGSSLKYTAVDEQGRYQFSNIPCGRYQIDLESKLKGSGRYQMLHMPSVVELPIPVNYEESSAVGDLDFKLLAL